jgi:formylglycine-generating enzyme
MKTNKTSGIIRTMIRGLMCLPLLALSLVAQNVSRLTLKESTDLTSWQTVPVTPAMLDANGKILVPTNTAQKQYRLQLEFLIPPTFTTQPASVSITSGQTTTLTVAASGTVPLTYQWYQGSAGTTTTPVGTNSASYTTPALTATTDYWVQVTNEVGAVNSSGATVTVTGGVVPADMASIPAGTFTMGRTSGDAYSDAPPVTVTVSEFYMGTYEVTKALWDEVRTYGAANGYTDLSVGGGKASNHPVHTIGWFDIVKWCNARSQKDGLTPVYTVSGATMKTGTSVPTANWSANGYRLPTEAEWEKAARGGVSGKRFPWGTDTISHSQANYYSSTIFTYDVSPTRNWHPTYATGSTVYSSPVGSFAANGYGLYDMAGNMGEWCWDWYGGATYVSGSTDPRGPASGVDRVLRGGTWSGYADSCRAAFRINGPITHTDSRIGFRVARSSVPEDMALIPAGSFTMGRTSGDTDISDAPPVTVTVSAFYMGKYEVTKALWDEVLTYGAANGYTDLSAGEGKASNHPVHTISWFDMLKWCNARSQKEGLTPVYTVSGSVMKTGTSVPIANWSASGYRLPTEAEWEKAARGGVSGKRFPWGTDTSTHSQANYSANSNFSYDLSGAVNNYHPSYATGSTPYSSPVDSFAPNGYGLYDMAGNMLEWCWDLYGATSYVSGATDPRGAVSGSLQVFRGGSWSNVARDCRVAVRFGNDPSSPSGQLGFRFARGQP